jgi:putative ABC transport system permease protein
MTLFNAILIGFKDIWAHKFRSILTMLGIVLGVASLVGMAAIVKGMENGLKETMVAMGGADRVVIQSQQVPIHQEHLADQAPGSTMADVMALESSAPLIRLVSPEMSLTRVTVSRGDKVVRPRTCAGVLSSVLEMNLHTLASGRFFNDLDEEMASSVCVIGTGIRDELFGSPEETGLEIDPVGEMILINGEPFTIIGMFIHYESEQDRKRRELAAGRQNEPSAGPARMRGWGGRGRGGAFWWKNNTVYMPLNTAWVRFRSTAGTNNIPDPRLSSIQFKVHDIEMMDLSLQQARNVLLMTRNGIEDFTFRTQENQVENINTQIRNARISGGIIAAISLLVGGIGIMNIMLASINERIREIGICKAIGASGGVIFLQILTESVTLSFIGALAGLLAAVKLVSLLALVSPTQNAPVITAEAMLLGCAFSLAVGIMAGLFPAYKASSLNPIQALRFE